MKTAPFYIIWAAALVLLPAAYDMAAYAQDLEPDGRKFLPAEVYPSLDASMPYVEFGRNNHVTIDAESMRADGAADLDIEIVTKWAIHLNAFLDAVASGNQAAIKQALADSKSGQFSLITNPPSVVDPTWAGGSHVLTRIIGDTACGGTHNDRSTWQGPPASPYPYTGYASSESLESRVRSDGYVDAIPFSSNWGKDFQKTNHVGMGGCTGGEFRDQRVIKPASPRSGDPDLRVGWYVHQHTNEPNPQVHTYVWPTLWWPIYAAQWHDLH